MNNDSSFEVRITQKAVLKGDAAQVRKETYTTWAIADSVYCLYRDLAKIQGSGILEVDLIEHRREQHHRHAERTAEGFTETELEVA